MSLTPQEEATLKSLNQLLNMGNSIEEASAQLRTMLQNDSLIDRVLTERQAIVDSRRQISTRGVLFDPEEMPEPWYSGSLDTDKFWPKLRKHLASDPSWAAAVDSLDSTSDAIVGMLADPHSELISTRGLVLGYVQSGKTANFTATIAKAADAGYRLFIVLSGVHNTLRRQTQLRLDEQLAELNPTDWVQLTDEFRDFGNPVKALPLVAGTQLRLMAVVKKNVSRLEKLRDWLEKAHEQGGLDNCPVLIIDDEADQAGINSHRDPELDRTRINEELVGLLKLPRVAYVGYTATPFANFLANPADQNDIYPRHFIYSLPKPGGYFGAEELFAVGKSEDEYTDSEAPHDLVRFVSDDEADLYRVKAKVAFVPQLTPSLRTAVRWFVLATAARRFRAGEKKHSSMLVHTTMRVHPQLQYVDLLTEYVVELRKAFASGETEAWQAEWEAEIGREPAERHGLDRVEFSQLSTVLGSVLSETKIVADNSQSDERLLYSDAPATVIAVGGNTLARGLTLHGLVSSYFLRTASTYDSVLQMGRWFGYRPGYADLPRVWTTKDLADDFRFLAEVERDIREDIGRYPGGDVTPRELAVRILLHPRMSVTSRLKMYFAVTASASYSEHRPQTTYFAHTDDTVALSNLDAVRRLVKHAAPTKVERTDSYALLGSIEAANVLAFLREFSVHPASEMSGQSMSAYIEDQLSHGALGDWNVAIVTRKSSAETVDLGLAEPVNLITRSRLDVSTDPKTANIGTLMSRQDRLVDLGMYNLSVESTDREIQDARNALGKPLLLVYPIDKNSSPKANAKLRTPLDAKEHLTGLAVVFPKAAEGSTSADKIQVDLRVADTAEVDELADEPPYQDDEGSQDEVKLDE